MTDEEARQIGRNAVWLADHPAAVIGGLSKRQRGMHVCHSREDRLHTAHAELPVLPRALQANPFLPENFGPTLAEIGIHDDGESE